jgi:hypothetical protein
MKNSFFQHLMPLISLVYIALTQAALADQERFWPVTLPGDNTLNQTHGLMPYMRAAVSRELPVRYFRELISAGSSVVVVEGNWPSYKPRANSGGVIISAWLTAPTR